MHIVQCRLVQTFLGSGKSVKLLTEPEKKSQLFLKGPEDSSN